MAMIPIVELGVAEAHLLLSERFGFRDLPPLDAIENEDWGRDYLLSRFLEIPASQLAECGLIVDEDELADGPTPDTTSFIPSPAADTRPAAQS